MATNKTVPTDLPVSEYLEAFPSQKQEEANQLIDIMEQLTGAQAVMWGTSIIGFGQYPYRYASGRSGDWFYCGFALRKRAISLYISCDLKSIPFDWKRLGTHEKSVGCVYVKKLSDIHLEALEELIKKAMLLLDSKN